MSRGKVELITTPNGVTVPKPRSPELNGSKGKQERKSQRSSTVITCTKINTDTNSNNCSKVGVSAGIVILYFIYISFVKSAYYCLKLDILIYLLIVKLPSVDESRKEKCLNTMLSKTVNNSNLKSSNPNLLGKQINGGILRSISSPLITLKSDRTNPPITPTPITNPTSVAHPQRNLKHTYHEIYIDLQNSIMLEHETDAQYGKIGLSSINTDINCPEDNTYVSKGKERLEMVEEEHDEEQAKNYCSGTNSVLESYAELKAWTNNSTDTILRNDKV